MRIAINYKYTPSLKIIADSFSLTLSFIIILFIPIQHKEFLRSYAIAGIIGYCILKSSHTLFMISTLYDKLVR